jgi:hypothetical protein
MNLANAIELQSGGPGSGRKPGYAKGLNKWKSREEELKRAAKDPKQIKLPLKAGGPGSGRHPGYGKLLPNKGRILTLTKPLSLQHRSDHNIKGPVKVSHSERLIPKSFSLGHPNDWGFMGNVVTKFGIAPGAKILEIDGKQLDHWGTKDSTYLEMGKEIRDVAKQNNVDVVKVRTPDGWDYSVINLRVITKDIKSAQEENVEMEGFPQSPGTNKSIKQVGTQFCVTSDGVDKNLGCWPSMKKANAVKDGKSFIEPDLDDPGDVDAGGFTSTGWSYGKKTTPVGYVAPRSTAGFPTGKLSKVGLSKGRMPKAPAARAPSMGTGHHLPNQSMTHGTGSGHRFPNPSMHVKLTAGGPGSGRHPYAVLIYRSGKHSVMLRDLDKDKAKEEMKDRQTGERETRKYDKTPSGTAKFRILEHSPGENPNDIAKRADDKWGLFRKEVKSFADMGEPMAGALQHAHLDSNLFFHPPSLKKPDHIPVDDPKETNNRFLDVTKRKERQKDRMKILKRGVPGGNPPLIPARTTLIAPHTAGYQPGMFSSSVKVKPRKNLDDAKMRTSYARRGCI